MTKSMTAFAKVRFTAEGRQYQIEISSVNRKGFDFYLYSPREFSFLETAFRKQIMEVTSRGQVTVRFSPDQVKGNVSLDLFKKVHLELHQVAKSLDPRFEVSFENVLEWAKSGGDLAFEETELVTASLEALHLAIKDWLAMKEVEGKALANDLLDRAHLIEKALSRIESYKDLIVSRLREKLLEKIQEVKELIAEDQERVLREVVIYAERVDVSEEITRLKSHISQLKTLLGKKGESAGRGLDFLIREMQREANTISSKATDLTLIQDSLLIKEEIEKMREQVQNIE